MRQGEIMSVRYVQNRFFDKLGTTKIDRAKFVLLELGAARTGGANRASWAPDGLGCRTVGLLHDFMSILRVLPVIFI